MTMLPADEIWLLFKRVDQAQRNTYVGNQRIVQYCGGLNRDGSLRTAVLVNGEAVDMSFDEAVLRASNGERLAWWLEVL